MRWRAQRLKVIYGRVRLTAFFFSFTFGCSLCDRHGGNDGHFQPAQSSDTGLLSEATCTVKMIVWPRRLEALEVNTPYVKPKSSEQVNVMNNGILL